MHDQNNHGSVHLKITGDIIEQGNFGGLLKLGLHV